MTPAVAEIVCFVGWVERSETHHRAEQQLMGIAPLHPSIAARHGDGFRSALPILRSIRFLPLLASLLSRPSMAIRTVAALRQSWPFRHGPVVLRFANRPR